MADLSSFERFKVHFFPEQLLLASASFGFVYFRIKVIREQDPRTMLPIGYTYRQTPRSRNWN